MRANFLAIGCAALFWLVDMAIVRAIETQSLLLVVIRNFVLIGGVALIWVPRRNREALFFGSRFAAPVFALFLWILGALMDTVIQIQEQELTVEAGLRHLAIFPLTTLGLATYSGILPALLGGTLIALWFGSHRGTD